jgi:hypothetical protein
MRYLTQLNNPLTAPAASRQKDQTARFAALKQRQQQPDYASPDSPSGHATRQRHRHPQQQARPKAGLFQHMHSLA